MNKLIDRMKRNKLVNDTNAIGGLGLGLFTFLPSIFSLITLLVVVFLIYWILSNIIIIAIGLFVIVLAVVLLKKYVLPQKKEVAK